jgi:hypothetical protein
MTPVDEVLAPVRHGAGTGVPVGPGTVRSIGQMQASPIVVHGFASNCVVPHGVVGGVVTNDGVFGPTLKAHLVHV